MPAPPLIFTSGDGASQPHLVVLYYPARQKDGAQVDNHEGLAQGLELLLCQEMGGVTRYPAVGNYTTGSGVIHREKVEVLEVYCDASKWEHQRRFLQILAGGLARALNQESIALAVDGRLYLISEPPRCEEPGDFSPMTHLTPSEIADVLRERILQTLGREG